MKFYQQRRELLEASKKMTAAGLSRGTSGNLSMRVEDGALVCHHCKVIEAMMDSIAGPFDRAWSVGNESPN